MKDDTDDPNGSSGRADGSPVARLRIKARNVAIQVEELDVELRFTLGGAGTLGGLGKRILGLGANASVGTGGDDRE